jgi:hypothetical protein
MAELRPHFNNSGSVNIPWETAQDENLSFLARGVLLDALSRPPGWDFSIDRMARSCKATVKGSGRDALASAMRELEDAGYRRVGHENGPDGRIRRWVQFAYRPVPEWAAAAAAARAKRKGGPTASRNTGSRDTASPNTVPPGEIPDHTVTREAVTREAGAIRETTPENTHTEVCVSHEHSDDDHAAGMLAIERTTHPDAVRLLTGAELAELAERAASLIAAGWTRAALEAKLSRRTNAATHSPFVVLGRVLRQLAAEPVPPAPSHGTDGSRVRGRALDAAGRLDIDDAALARLTVWLNRAPLDAVRAWLAEPRPLDAEPAAAER